MTKHKTFSGMCWRKLEVGGRGGPHLDLTTAYLFIFWEPPLTVTNFCQFFRLSFLPSCYSDGRSRYSTNVKLFKNYQGSHWRMATMCPYWKDPDVFNIYSNCLHLRPVSGWKSLSTAITRNINIRHQAAVGQRRVEETVTAVLAAAGGC